MFFITVFYGATYVHAPRQPSLNNVYVFAKLCKLVYVRTLNCEPTISWLFIDEKYNNFIFDR